MHWRTTILPVSLNFPGVLLRATSYQGANALNSINIVSFFETSKEFFKATHNLICLTAMHDS